MKKHQLLYLFFLLLPFFLFAQKTTCEKVGMNLSATQYWSSEVPFSNLMLQASPWISGNEGYVLGGENTNVADKMTFDTDGYPTEMNVAEVQFKI